jgi:hypothetical protein
VCHLRATLHAESRLRAFDGSLHASNQNESWEEMMQIGDPLRTIIVEPLELPVKQPTAKPEPEPIQSPVPEPEQVPAAP